MSATPLDPTAVVAFGTEVMRNAPIPDARLTEAPQFARGLDVNPDPTLDDRTAPILDALAEIAAAKPTREIVAVGLRLQLPQTELYVAANEPGVPAATLSMFDRLWADLRALSDLVASSSRRGPPGMWKQWKKPSPKRKPTPDQKQLEHQLMWTVYRHAREKARRRLEKWVPRLEAFAHAFWQQDQAAKNVDTTDRQANTLARVIDSLLMVRTDSETWDRWDSFDAPPPDFINHVTVMSVLVADAINLLKDQYILEEWTSHAMTQDPQTVVLRRALEKVISFHRHISTLILFAYSPRLRHCFTWPFSVVAVPPATPTMSMFTGLAPDYWKDVQSSLLDANDADPLETKDVPIPTSTKPGVHCECSLLAYLADHPDIAVFSYLGVSKLCCLPCFLWIQAYNRAPSTTASYYTRGCHRKWYCEWAAPRLRDPHVQDQVSSSFNSKIGSLVSTQLMQSSKARSRARSDPNDSSERMIETTAEEIATADQLVPKRFTLKAQTGWVKPSTTRTTYSRAGVGSK